MARFAGVVSALLTGADAAYSCPTGYKLVNDSATKICPGDDCGFSTCCDGDGPPAKKCSSYTCPAGYKAKEDSVNLTCGDDCETYECCDAETGKCAAHSCAAGKHVPASKHGTTGSSDADCCVDSPCSMWYWPGCPAGKYMPDSKKDTIGNDADKCCIDMPNCDDLTCGVAKYEGVIMFDSVNPKKNETYEPSSSDINNEYKCCTFLEKYCFAHTIACDAGSSAIHNKEGKAKTEGKTKAACCEKDTVTCDAYTEGGDVSAAQSGSRLNNLLAAFAPMSLFAAAYVTHTQ